MRAVGLHLGRIANRSWVPDKGDGFGSTSPLIHNPHTTRHREQHKCVPCEAPQTNYHDYVLRFTYYCMPVQFEQVGSCIHVLDVSPCMQPKNHIHLQLHSKVLSVVNIPRSNVQRWPHLWSPKAPSVLPSLCLRLASKCEFWAGNGGDKSTNILTVLTELRAKQVQTRSWITQWVNY